MHAAALGAWVGMVMVLALVTTNPLYLAIILLGVVLVAVLVSTLNAQARYTDPSARSTASSGGLRTGRTPWPKPGIIRTSPSGTSLKKAILRTGPAIPEGAP